MTSPEPQCVQAEFDIPETFPEEICQLWVQSCEEPAISTPFCVVWQGEFPRIVSIDPSYVFLGESVILSLTTENAQSSDPQVELRNGTEVVQATSVEQTGPDEIEATVDIPDDITPADWLVILSNLSGSGSEEWNVNNKVAVYSNATGTLRGRVVLGGSLDPVSDATITCTYKSDQTDILGAYEITDVPIGEHKVVCSSEDYLGTFEEYVTIIIDEIAYQNFALDWGTCNPNPPNLGKYVPPNVVISENIELGNIGSRSVEYLANIIPYDDRNRNFGELLFSFETSTFTTGNTLCGIETDGNYLYLGDYASSDINKIQFDGTHVETFSIPGVTSNTGLTFDGNYFYSGNRQFEVNEMDFSTHSLISTLNSVERVGAIAYDPSHNGFWVNNLASDIYLINRSGTKQDSIINPGYIQGMVYDDLSSDGPFLWCLCADDGYQKYYWIEQIDLATGMSTGITIPVSNDLGEGYGKGLFCSDEVVTDKVILGGVFKNDDTNIVFGYDITDYWARITENNSGDIPADSSVFMNVTLDATGMEAGEVHQCDIVIKNNAMSGDDVIIPITMVVSYDVDDPPSTQRAFSNHFPNPATGSVEIDYSIPQIHEGEDTSIYIYLSLIHI